MTTSTYRVLDYDSIVTDTEDGRVYTIDKIRDRAPEDKPREKLIRLGPSVLSTPELLSVILNTGTKKEEVLAMSARVLKEYGEKSLVSQKNVEAFAKDLDIPTIKAAQIVACAELGRRFFQKNANGLPTIRSAKDVFEYVGDMRALPKEHLRGIYLNAHHKIIHDEIISIGTVNTNIIHPREVFKPAVEYMAAAVVVVHNHPSGVIKPSEADIEVTKRLVHAGRILGIALLDHIIITKSKFKSISVEYN